MGRLDFMRQAESHRRERSWLQPLRMSTAMAAGVTTRLWDVADLMALLIESENSRPPNDG
jgi:hypothetical protein